MSLLEAVVLGIVQGLTEFLPISSSGHLRIVPALLGWDDPGAAFTAVTQLGTAAAVIIYFRRDLWAIARALLRDPRARREPEARLGWYIVAGTVPIGVLGFAFRDQIETGARNLWLIGTVLIVFGLVLLWADRRGAHERELERISVHDGVLIGLAQSLALIPGVSRSGATISAGLLLGLRRPDAARFAFLLSIPAVLASGLFELRDIGGSHEDFAPVAVATVVAFVTGYAAIAWLLRYLAHHSLELFVVYRVAVGALVLALLAAGEIS